MKKSHIIAIVITLVFLAVLVAGVLLAPWGQGSAAPGNTAGGTSGSTGGTTLPGTTVHTHAFSDWVETEAPTCEGQGLSQRQCQCGEIEVQAIAPLGHSIDSWTVTQAAGCETDGTQEGSCTRCGQLQTEAIPATGHSWDAGVCIDTLTDCNDTGSATYTCTVCGATKTETVQGPHSFGDYQWEYYTYKDEVVSGHFVVGHYTVSSHKKYHVCTKCEYLEEIPTPDHECSKNAGDFSAEVIQQATCDQNEITNYTCNICGWSFQKKHASTGHNYTTTTQHLSDYTETTNELDVNIRQCSLCGDVHYTYTPGKGWKDVDTSTAQYPFAFDLGTAYVNIGHYFYADPLLYDHPEWQTVLRNPVYQNGQLTQVDVIWYDTAIGKHCTQTVVVANIPKDFSYVGYTYYYEFSYGTLKAARVSFNG